MNNDKHVAFSTWYRANREYLVTQPFTEFIAAAAWKAGRADALEQAIRECEADAFADQWAGLAEAEKRIRALKDAP